MKSATLPAVSVEPELRAEIESLLTDGETLSDFVEASVRRQAERRRVDVEFVARARRSLEASQLANDFVSSDVMLARLQAKLDAAKKLMAERAATRLAESSTN